MSLFIRLASASALALSAAPALPQERGALLPVQQEWLAEHNAARADAGQTPLRWNAGLARDAKAWAKSLAARGTFQHDPLVYERGQGENLWQGTQGRFAPWQMVDAFVAEKRHFRVGTFPNVSRTGRWSDVGHYTQIIWPETREVGCAAERNARDEVLVCRYYPAGNVIGTRLDPGRRLSRR